MPGILSGAMIVFALAASAFATPAIIGGRRLKVASTLAYDEFLNTLNWPLGAAVAVLLLVALVADRRRLQPPGRAPLRAGVRMSRNGPLALAFHALFVDLHAGADRGRLLRSPSRRKAILSLPTDALVAALVPRRSRAIPSSSRAFWRSLWLGALSSAIAVAVLGAGGARHRALPLPRPRGDDGAVHVAADDPARRARHRLPALLHRRSGWAAPSSGWCWRTS